MGGFCSSREAFLDFIWEFGRGPLAYQCNTSYGLRVLYRPAAARRTRQMCHAAAASEINLGTKKR